MSLGSPATPEPHAGSPWRARLALGLPVLFAVVLMVPRILHAQFGLFDDPGSVTVADQTWAGAWDWRADIGQYGRFRPVYWLSFSLLYGLAGKHPQWYFIANLVLLAGTTFLLSAIVLRLTGRPLAAGVTGAAFVLGGPVVEAAYTLSKPELLQSFLLTGAAGVVLLRRQAVSTAARVSRVVLAGLLVLLAALTKETTGLVAGVSAAWLVFAWLGRRLRREADARPPLILLVDLLLASIFGIAAYVVGALILSPSTTAGAGPVANFTFNGAAILGNWNIWKDWLVRDWLYLLPLAGCMLLLAIWRRKLDQLPLVVGSMVWMVPWLAVYLPYRFTPEYYLLPFSLGAAVLAGAMVIEVWDVGRTAPVIRRIAAGGCLAAAGFLLALTIPNDISTARIQLAVDQANATMLGFVAESAPRGASILVNIPWDIEYLAQAPVALHALYGRPDMEVAAYEASADALADRASSVIVLSPSIENVPLQTVRLGIPEAESRQWEAALQEELGSRLQLLREVRAEAPLLVIDAPRLICLAVPDIGYCQVPNTPFDTRRFAQIWRVYAVTPAAN